MKVDNMPRNLDSGALLASHQSRGEGECKDDRGQRDAVFTKSWTSERGKRDLGSRTPASPAHSPSELPSYIGHSRMLQNLAVV